MVPRLNRLHVRARKQTGRILWRTGVDFGECHLIQIRPQPFEWSVPGADLANQMAGHEGQRGSKDGGDDPEGGMGFSGPPSQRL